LNHSATSIFGTGNRGKYDLSVTGGSEAVRYFVSGGLSNEMGVIQMPPVFKQLADTAHLGLPSSALNPNSEQQRSVHVNTAIKLGLTADLTATGSYLSTYQQTPDAATLYVGAFEGLALSDAAHYYGYGYAFAPSLFTPLGELSALGSQNTDRVTGGLTANWRPAGWFVGHATVGLDHGSQRNESLNYPLANATYQYLGGAVLGLAEATTDVYSVDLRGTATASLTPGLRAVTSGGLQMVDTRTVGQSALASNITATNLTLNGAAGAAVSQRGNRQATLGGYGEEQLSVADRLFLTGALRLDAGSGFGRAYATAAYPKASVSWLALNRGATTVRLRGAFGESGVQPTNGAALLLYAPNVTYLGGSAIASTSPIWPGNPHLKPERSTEFEGGLDVGAWGTRVSLELTGYAKTTHDALVNLDIGELAGSPYQENIGEVRNTGIETSLTAGIIDDRWVAWDVAVSVSVNHNTLISLAPGVAAQLVGTGFGAQYRQALGFPLYGIWAQRVRYADANHDGIIGPSDVTIADSASYIGSSLPTQEASVSTHVRLWRGAVTAGGLVDYRGGYRIANAVGASGDRVGNSRGANDPAAPLLLQARAVANNAQNSSFNALNVEDGAFVRLREVSVTYAVPQRVARALRVQSLSVTGAVRNLALWTRYTGVDPEVSNTGQANVQSVPTSGGFDVNNDLREDGGGVPLARYWVMRLNLGI
jgi:outer membrane receptor protein involved in Fe transport